MVLSEFMEVKMTFVLNCAVLPPRVGGAARSLSQFWYGTFCVGISLGRSLRKRPFLPSSSPLSSPTLPFKAPQTAARRPQQSARRLPSPRAPARPGIQADAAAGTSFMFSSAAPSLSVSISEQARSGGLRRTDASSVFDRMSSVNLWM